MNSRRRASRAMPRALDGLADGRFACAAPLSFVSVMCRKVRQPQPQEPSGLTSRRASSHMGTETHPMIAQDARPVPGRRPVLLLDGRRRRQGRLDDAPARGGTTSRARRRGDDRGRSSSLRSSPGTRGGPPTTIDLGNRRAPLHHSGGAGDCVLWGCAPRSPSGPAAVHLRRATAAAATATVFWRRRTRRPRRRSLVSFRKHPSARPAALKQHTTSTTAPLKNPCFRCARRANGHHRRTSPAGHWKPRAGTPPH